MNFGLIGAAGFIAPKHLKAIHDTENELIAAVDLHDSVGRLDSYFPAARFFTEIEQFERFLEQWSRDTTQEKVQYISICTPNYLHDAHVRLALRSGANAICEKPLVIAPGDLNSLLELESESKNRIFSVLQLRLLPKLVELRESIQRQVPKDKIKVDLTYITRRGSWYDTSWKGAPGLSGGVALNIGIHFFDLLIWLFGSVEESQVHLKQGRKAAGVLHLERAQVRWFLSTDSADLPDSVKENGGYAYRSMTMDGQEIEFSDGFTELHTRVYEEILAGRGTGILDAQPSLELAHSLSNCEIASSGTDAHPYVKRADWKSAPSLVASDSKAA